MQEGHSCPHLRRQSVLYRGATASVPESSAIFEAALLRTRREALSAARAAAGTQYLPDRFIPLHVLLPPSSPLDLCRRSSRAKRVPAGIQEDLFLWQHRIRRRQDRQKDTNDK